jgi:hypothetical protein
MFYSHTMSLEIANFNAFKGTLLTYEMFDNYWCFSIIHLLF